MYQNVYMFGSLHTILQYRVILFIIDKLVKNFSDLAFTFSSIWATPAAPGFNLVTAVFVFTSYGEYDLLYPSEPFI